MHLFKDQIIVRETEQKDIALLKILYRRAFVEENLFPLVIELLDDKRNTLNLSAVYDSDILGHIAFTQCHASPENITLALLGPMAVLPKYQRNGIGSTMIKKGFNMLKKKRVNKILVLGDPNYYSRFGFTEEINIQPSYSIPKEWKPAWQSVMITDCFTPPSGKLIVPKAWQRQELWSD